LIKKKWLNKWYSGDNFSPHKLYPHNSAFFDPGHIERTASVILFVGALTQRSQSIPEFEFDN